MLTRAFSLRIKKFSTEIKVTLHAFVSRMCHISKLCTRICDMGVGADSFCPLCIPVMMTADGRMATLMEIND